MLIERLQGRAGDAADARETIVSQIIVRTMVIVVMMGALLAAFIWVAARKADELAIERQQHLIATVLAQSSITIAHDQEASTVWDDAVRQMHAPRLDDDWIDNNLGIWFHTYYDHDEVFIVDARDRTVYAMRDGRRVDAGAYARSIGSVAAPLIRALRAQLRGGAELRRSAAVHSPGETDLRIVHGHPAIVSVKPIVPETDRVAQPRGAEYLHVSIRYLDGSLVSDLAAQYELSGGRFSRTVPVDGGLSRVPLHSRDGALVGYFAWTPFRPGTAMLARVAPALVAALLLVFAIVAWLLRRISSSTLQLSAAKSRAQHLANHDPLTGLANRALFDQRLSTGLAQLPVTRHMLALLYVDLDHFKNVNDHLGHPTGDLLIRALARILRELAPHDVVARLGGDEFAIVHVAQDAPASAERLAGNIHRALARPIQLDEGEVLIGASIGIAVAPGDATDAVELVRKADIALYDAKLGGRRRTSFFTGAMGERIRERNQIEADLRAAMRSGDGLDIVYQPFFAAQSGRLLGAEALVRWHHPVRGSIFPEQFIPVAEESGLMETLNEWVLEQACEAAARWPSGTLSVNLSGVQLRNATLAERIYTTLKRTRLSPARLQLEIGEANFLDCDDSCRHNLGWLRDIGVRIALDNFGTGYSPFKQLRGIEIDRIKIDRSFIATIDLAQGGSPVVQAIVDLARVSGLATTAEGVETEQQRQFLTSIGCDILQGFLFAQPESAAAIDARFRAEGDVGR